MPFVLTLVYANGSIQQLTGAQDQMEAVFYRCGNQPDVRYAILLDTSGNAVGNEYAALANA
jgi:hypothetical protein